MQYVYNIYAILHIHSNLRRTKTTTITDKRRQHRQRRCNVDDDDDQRRFLACSKQCAGTASWFSCFRVALEPSSLKAATKLSFEYSHTVASLGQTHTNTVEHRSISCSTPPAAAAAGAYNTRDAWSRNLRVRASAIAVRQ